MNAIIVIEQYSELRRALDAAAALGVRPRLGLRAKLATRHGGHWGCTSGDGAKFGLRPREIVSVVNLLASEGMLDCLALLHFHVGSQITNIRVVKEVMREASFLYAELVKVGSGWRWRGGGFVMCGRRGVGGGGWQPLQRGIMKGHTSHRAEGLGASLHWREEAGRARR